MNKGFIYVASKQRWFYNMACQSALSLKDCVPDAHITLYTHNDFIDKKSNIFDNIITEIPVHERTKMWACAKTPYEKTVYLDSDTFVHSDEIMDLFNYADEYDLSFVNLEKEVPGNVQWAFADKDLKLQFKYHGGLFVFRNKSLVLDFMSTWFTEYDKQVNNWNFPQYNPNNRKWDMLTLWRLFNEEQFSRFHSINVGIIDKKFHHTLPQGHNHNLIIDHYPKDMYFDREPDNGIHTTQEQTN